MAGDDLGIPGIEDAVEIGRGGFGVVYRAWQPALERQVAVKTLLARGLSSASGERFVREARALGRVSSHPNIVTIFDVGIAEDGHPYLLMQFLESGSLAERIASDGPLAPGEVLRIGIKLAGALETAHQSSILHRDVKPENVLVSDYGEPELADFGIARVSGGFETTTGLLTASLHHAAPELLEGAAPSARSDVYSLASTLYTLLAGRPPFVAGEDEAMVALYLRIATAPVPELSAFGVPAPLWEVLEAALAKEPSRRPATAAAFGEALQRVQIELGEAVTPLPIRSPAVPDAQAVEDPPAPRPAQPPTPAPSIASTPTESVVVPVPSPPTQPAGAALVPTAPVAAVASVPPVAAPEWGVPADPAPPPSRGRWPIVVAVVAAVAVVGAVLLVLQRREEPSGVASALPVEPTCEIFPADNPWNTEITDLEVHSDSDAWVASMEEVLAAEGKDPSLVPAFGRTGGTPYSVIPADATDVEEVEVRYNGMGDEDLSDPDPFPLRAGDTDAAGGLAIVVDDRDCTLHEVYSPTEDTAPWTDAYASAVWDLDSNELRPDQHSAAGSAGLPLFPGLARASELAADGGAGVIDHALRFSSPAARDAFMHPATDGGLRDDVDEDWPPFGARMRLKSDTDCSEASPAGQSICQALKTYGMVLGDKTGFRLAGAPDPRWPSDEVLLADLGRLSIDDFEFVDTGEEIVPGS